jgi:hypothetical protein
VADVVARHISADVVGLETAAAPAADEAARHAGDRAGVPARMQGGMPEADEVIGPSDGDIVVHASRVQHQSGSTS